MGFDGDRVCWSKAKAVIKCVLSYSDMTPSQMDPLRPGERDKVFADAYDRMCGNIMQVTDIDDFGSKRIGEMSFLTLYDYVKNPKSGLGKRKQHSVSENGLLKTKYI